MRSKIAVVGALFVASACTSSDLLAPRFADRPLFQGVPADGNKVVTPIDITFPAFATCPNGASVDLRAVGWIQDRPGGEPANQPGIVTFYFDFIFSNAAGETYVWHQVGSQRYYTDGNGNFVFSTAGRTLDLVGRIVINITTGEVVEFVAGRNPALDNLVCAALT